MSVQQHEAAPFRTSPSAIARYFFHDCQRFLRYDATRPQRRQQEGVPDTGFDHSPLVQAILESGHAWEETVVRQWLGDRVRVAPGPGEIHTRRFDWAATLNWLRNPQSGTHLYQPTLRLPRWFYHQYGIDPALVVISDNHPDLLSVVDVPGQSRRVLRVVDLKRGESLELTHRVQVLLYALELDAILRTEGIDDLQVDLSVGQVWLGGHAEPTPFDLKDFRPHLERFLRDDLCRVLRAPAHEADWHVYQRCEWCNYFQHCRQQMQEDNDVSRLSQLTVYGKQYLRQEVQVRDVDSLGQFLQRDDADRVLSQCASLAGRGPRLKQQIAALQTESLRTHGAASPALSKGENIGLFFTLQQEPLGNSIYLAGISLTVRKDLRGVVFSEDVVQRFFDDKGKGRPFILLADKPDRIDETRREWVGLLYDIITQVDRYNRDREWREQLSLQAYVVSERERELLIEWLMQSLQDEQRPELAEKAMSLLFHFQAPELLVADQHPDREVPFPVVSLLDALQHVLALPVEVSYTLPEALAALGSRLRYARSDYFHFPLGHGLRAEAIHAAWYRGKTEVLPDIARQAVAYLRAARELLQGIRHHAAEAIFAWTAKFSLPGQEEYQDALLSRLAFFARYESLLDCLDRRQTRCEPHAVQLLLGKVMELESRGENEFEIVSGAAMPVEPGGFPEWLLVTNDEAGKRAQLEYRDYACRSRLWQGKPQPNLAVVGVTDVRCDKLGTPARLSVDFAKPFAADGFEARQRFLLYPRFTDYTTDGVVKFLREYQRAIDRQGDGELFLSLLRDPATQCGPQPLPDDVASAADELTDSLQLTPSQREAFRAVCERRVVPVWGPPGTGKTHFLAAAILGLAAAHAKCGRPFRVLVTAFTHAAIENLLRKIASLAGRIANPSCVQIAKAKIWQGDDDPPVEVLEETRLPKWLKRHEHAVVGATVYSCLKTFDKLPDFDLIVIDEASQVRVPEAAVPIGLAGRTGRLVLAGDHLQLPPIVNGVYPEVPPDEPMLHRSVFEAVASRGEAERLETAWQSVLRASPFVRQLTENFRMNDVLTSFSAGLLYGRDYRPNDESIAARRLNLTAVHGLDPFVQTCLDPDFPLVVVVLDGVWAARENVLEAQLVARLVTGLRSTSQYQDDTQFFRDGVFLVSPHRAQIELIQRELRRQRMWQRTPFVDTVDKMQGQEADAVIVSYGVSDPEFAAQEAEFIYGLNRLNVAITRARSKCVVFLPRPLLDASPQVLDRPEATRGLAFMRQLVTAVARSGQRQSFDLDDGASAVVFRTNCIYDAHVDGEPAAGANGVTPDYVDDETEPTGDVMTGRTAKTKSARRAKKSSTKKRTAAAARKKPVTSERSKLLISLNQQQREAASHGDEPLLIVAGAGTGKTTTLVHRVAHLIAQGADPGRLMLLTFTRRAAAEMLQRVAEVVNDRDVSRRVWGGTFHAIGIRLLRMYGAGIGLHPRFTVHDRPDSESLMGQITQDLELAKKDKKFPKKGTCMAIHSYTVNAELSLDETLKQQFDNYAKYAQPLEKLFAEYSARKTDLNVLDYDDLLSKWCELLEHEETGDLLRRRFDCVLVDEFQDTNRLQSRLLAGLRPDGRGLSVVGDDAQSIYSFRAATVRNILDFPKLYAGTRVVTLEQNYRSTQPILKASNRVIAQARERFTKDLWSERSEGSLPQLISCEDDAEQVDFVVARILAHHREGVPLSEQAVLIRAAHHSIKLEAALKSHDLPYVKYGGLKFTETAHVKDLTSLLRLAENPHDRVAGERALSLLSGIGPKKAGQLQQQLIAAEGKFEAWKDVKVPAAAAELWPKFVALMTRLDTSPESLSDQVRRVMEFYSPLMEQQYDNAQQRANDLEQVQQLAKQYEDRSALLADMAIDPPSGAEEFTQAKPEDRLVLSTLHSAKGLEWKVVYVLHAVEGKIPLQRSMFDPEQLEEERRMFYVALTRAADWLYVCHPLREALDQRGSWYAEMNASERLDLTRFVTKSARKEFESQRANLFQTPTPRPADKVSAGESSRRRARGTAGRIQKAR